MAIADWLYNYPRGRIFPPFVWQRSKRFFAFLQLSAPPLPTPTIMEKPICENFIRLRDHDGIMHDLLIKVIFQGFNNSHLVYRAILLF